MADITTLYLLPHSHTDIGYTHDPLITWELHNRFLDRAIELCEATAEMPPASAFHWTVEVFASLEHWWEHRSKSWRRRLLAAMERGQIDAGVRYTNGTQLQTAADIEWEMQRVDQWMTAAGVRLNCAMQNDVNGFSLAYAEAMAARGFWGLMMGLNTTMGKTPCPRPSAWRWLLPSGREVLTWNGWIYNRLRSFFDLDRLATELPEKLDTFLAHVPDDYPFDFVATSATMNDNVGPFASLPEQVSRYNEAGHPVKVVLTTLTGYLSIVRRERQRLGEKSGEWNDAWVFGHGSMPQETAAVRRAQRRLAAVNRIRELGWAEVEIGSLTMDRARYHLAIAMEHTYGSHSSVSVPGSPDTQRQWAQVHVEAWKAESIAMGLLRDHLTAVASGRGVSEPSVLVCNPSPGDLTLRAVYESKGLRLFARDQVAEHLFQFDREPTRDAMLAAANVIAESVVPGETALLVTAVEESRVPVAQSLPTTSPSGIEDGYLRVIVDPEVPGITSLITLDDNHEWVGTELPALFTPVLERPTFEGGFTGRDQSGVRDPSDQAWREDLTFDREVTGHVVMAEHVRDARGEAIVLHFADSALQRLHFRLDPLLPGVLEVTADFWFTTDLSRQAYYLATDWSLADDGAPVSYFYDSAGLWLQAGRDLLPGASATFFEAGAGVAVRQGERAVIIAAADTPLWQFGGFSFGDPDWPVPDRHGFVASWIYNNYWFCNFNSCAPGGFSCRYLVRPTQGAAADDGAAVAQLAWQFAADDLTHPLVPKIG